MIHLIKLFLSFLSFCLLSHVDIINIHKQNNYSPIICSPQLSLLIIHLFKFRTLEFLNIFSNSIVIFLYYDLKCVIHKPLFIK